MIGVTCEELINFEKKILPEMAIRDDTRLKSMMSFFIGVALCITNYTKRIDMTGAE